jgi:Cupin domain
VTPRAEVGTLEQTVLECEPGTALARETGSAEEVLFVLEGNGTLTLDGRDYELEPESGAYLAPGERYELSGSLRAIESATRSQQTNPRARSSAGSTSRRHRRPPARASSGSLRTRLRACDRRRTSSATSPSAAPPITFTLTTKSSTCSMARESSTSTVTSARSDPGPRSSCPRAQCTVWRTPGIA